MAKILLIEDSEISQEAVSLILGNQGHQVEVAKDLRTGIRKLREAEFDLILMDLNLPGVRGEYGTKFVRQRLQLDTPIIIVSGEIQEETREKLEPLGVSGFVAKEEDFEPKLTGEIARVLGGEEGGS
jgi:CheY-like chemotaxis protein